jgi:hypothetical protein
LEAGPVSPKVRPVEGMVPSATTRKDVIMKTIALLSLALVVAAAAHAEAGAEDFDLQNRSQAAPSALTRAEVQAEYMRAAAAGEVQYGEGGSAFVINQQAGSPRDVGAVREEAIQAARSHPQDVA